MSSIKPVTPMPEAPAAPAVIGQWVRVALDVPLMALFDYRAQYAIAILPEWRPSAAVM